MQCWGDELTQEIWIWFELGNLPPPQTAWAANCIMFDTQVTRINSWELWWTRQRNSPMLKGTYSCMASYSLTRLPWRHSRTSVFPVQYLSCEMLTYPMVMCTCVGVQCFYWISRDMNLWRLCLMGQCQHRCVVCVCVCVVLWMWSKRLEQHVFGEWILARVTRAVKYTSSNIFHFVSQNITVRSYRGTVPLTL